MLGASRVRILAIETSSPCGSVALLDDGKLVVELEHEQPNAHAERILPLVEHVLASAGFDRTSLDRVAVGIGPGSFTGLRVGIALAEGLALGLDIPIVGVASLRAMAAAAPTAETRIRIPVLDARRNEVFVAAYGAEGEEKLAPCALAVSGAGARLADLGSEAIYVGAFARLIAPQADRLEGREFDLPRARWVGAVAARLEAGSHAPDPIYVRGAGATLPNLPPSPISPSPPGSD
jgi:tRNA threonylcarbamoyladenosine biosynthesis protein TsaB